MSITLQDKSIFSLLGQCAACPSDNDQLFGIGVGDNDQRKYSTCHMACALSSEDMLRKRNRRYYCGCHKLGGLLEKHRQAATGSNHWIEMVYDSYEIHGRNIHYIPKLQHIHWNGQLVSQCNVHECDTLLNSEIWCMPFLLEFLKFFQKGGNSSQ